MMTLCRWAAPVEAFRENDETLATLWARFRAAAEAAEAAEPASPGAAGPLAALAAYEAAAAVLNHFARSAPDTVRDHARELSESGATGAAPATLDADPAARRAARQSALIDAWMLERLGDHAAAEVWLEMALRTAPPGDDEPALSLLLRLTLGRVLSALGRDEEAATSLRVAVEQATALDARDTLGEALCRLGGALTRQGKPAEARRCLEQGAPLCGAGGTRDLACEAQAHLSIACEALGDHAAALVALRASVALREQLIEARVAEQLGVLARRLQAERSALSRNDALTGLYNRRHVGELVAREISRARRVWRPLTFALVEVDHAAALALGRGEAVLEQVEIALAPRILFGLREHDVAARWGSALFCVVLPDTDATGAQVPLRRLFDQIRGEAVATDVGPVQVTVSIGVTHLATDDATIDDLMARAELALAEAHDAGDDRILPWDVAPA